MSEFILPFPLKRITGEFNTRSAYRIRNGLGAHRGTDWAMPLNTPIPAVSSGTIKYVGRSSILGHVIVQTVWAREKVWYVGYCHMAKAPTLKVGDKIEVGQTIGLLGNSGSASSGPHLHATLATTIKGVFYGEHNKVVFDLKEFLLEEIKKGQADGVKVTYTPKNTNVVVEVTKIPVGSKVRIRKDGTSVYYKTQRKAGVAFAEGITLTTTHEICVEVNDILVSSKKISPLVEEPKKVVPEKAESKVVAPVKETKATKAIKAPKVVRYSVKSGDTLSGIAKQFDIDVNKLAKENKIVDINIISVGQSLRIPAEPVPVAKEEVKICECCKRPL